MYFYQIIVLIQNYVIYELNIAILVWDIVVKIID